uniref:Uncharacterized protein n=1 Tax=Heterorhabditis bacteriophora TaxID=37862 RepID=A0A1I7WJR4_HETBA
MGDCFFDINPRCDFWSRFYNFGGVTISQRTVLILFLYFL